MSVTHVTIGDPPGSVGMGFTSLDANFCFCACDRCMSGSCCRWTPSNPTIHHETVRVSDGSYLPMWPTDAFGNPLVGYWTCACRTVVPPGVEHRCPEGHA